jgi:hypothetical protein
MSVMSVMARDRTMTETIERRDLTALVGELRDLSQALAAYDDEVLCAKLMLMIASRRAEIAARKREGGR